MIFGFLLAVAYNPFIFNSATQPRWAILAIAVPIMICANQSSAPNHLSSLHITGSAYLAWCGLTLAWTPNLWDGLNASIQLLIGVAVFALGARSNTLKPIFAGLALGLMISSLILLIPNDLFPLHQGLLGNPNMLAEAAVMTAIGCLAYGARWLIIGLLPAISLPQARGALLAGLVAVLILLWSRSRMLAITLASLSICALVILTNHRWAAGSSLTERWIIWTDTIKGLNWLGNGIGSYHFLYPFLTHSYDTAILRPEHAHNELLEIVFEVGAVGACLYASMVAIALRSATDITLPVLVAFCVIGLFGFPSHIPITLFIAALCLGHGCRARYGFRDSLDDRGNAVCYGRWSGPAYQRPSYHAEMGGSL